MTNLGSDTQRLLDCRQKSAREKLLAELFTGYREKLRLMVELRLDPRLRGKVDPSDLLQEAYLEAAQRLERYLEDPKMPLFIWLRRIAWCALVNLHRSFLGTQARDPTLEVQEPLAGPEASSSAMSRLLAGGLASPSEEAERREREEAVEKILESLEPLDREILALRFFEQLSSADAALTLGINEEAARKRYLRALRKFKSAYTRLMGSGA